MTDVAPTPAEPESREGDLRLAIQSVGLPHDAPWPQVVTALQANGLGDVLPSSAPAPASTEESFAAEGETSEGAVSPDDAPAVAPETDSPAPAVGAEDTATPEPAIDTPAPVVEAAGPAELLQIVLDALDKIETTVRKLLA